MPATPRSTGYNVHTMPERLYYADSALVRFDATVTDIRERSRTDGQSVWQIALDRTAFYPTSGGQPHDMGTLAATAPSGATLAIPVLAVEEAEDGEVWHLTHKPLLAGTAVQGTVDWARRLDHMQQHSGQHLLSAVFLEQLGARTVSFHLGEETSTIDLDVETIAPEDLARVETVVNARIAECRPVRQKQIGPEEAQGLLAAGQLRKLPPREGSIRVIEIEGVELNACGGTHVFSTGQIGGLLLRSTERARGGTRVSFVCGERAVRTAREDNALLARAGASLSTGRSELPDAILRLQAENKALHKQLAHMQEELANYHAVRLLVEDPIQHGRRVVKRVFPDRDATYVKLLASRLTTASPQTKVLFASTLEAPATVVVARSGDVEWNCGQQLKQALAAHGGRGGGTATLAQGQVDRTAVEAVLSELAA